MNWNDLLHSRKPTSPEPETSPQEVSQPSMAAEAVEYPMSTAPVTPEVKVENGFERFIDKLNKFIASKLPGAIKIAEAAEPILALTPAGPEYNLVVGAIAIASQASAASVAAGGPALTGEQKMAIAVQSSTPALTTILASKGVTSEVPAAISQFAQNVYNLQTGPAVATPAV